MISKIVKQSLPGNGTWHSEGASSIH